MTPRDQIQQALERLQQAIDIIASATLPEFLHRPALQLASIWENTALLVNRQIASGDTSGALDTVLRVWQQLAHIVSLLKPEAIAGRFVGEVFNQLETIKDQVKDTIDSLFWWGIGVGAGLLIGTGLLGYWLHKKGLLEPLVQQSVRYGKVAAKAALVGPPGGSIRMKRRSP